MKYCKILITSRGLMISIIQKAFLVGLFIVYYYFYLFFGWAEADFRKSLLLEGIFSLKIGCA